MKACGDLGCWGMTHWTVTFRALVPCALTLSPLRERFIPVPTKFDLIIPHQTTGNVCPKNWDFFIKLIFILLNILYIKVKYHKY